MIVILLFFLFYPITLVSNDYNLNSRSEFFLKRMLNRIGSAAERAHFRGTLHPKVKEILNDAQNFIAGDKKCLSKSVCFLFHGPVQVGKSRSAHLIAHTIDANIFYAPGEEFFIGYSESIACKIVNIAMIQAYFEEVRKLDKRSVIFIRNIERLLLPFGKQTYQYNSIVNTLHEEIDRCNNDPDRKIFIIATSMSDEIVCDDLQNIFNFNIIYFDYPDSYTRKELFLIVAEDKSIPLTETSAKELAKKTQGYTLMDVESIAKLAQKQAGSNPITAQDWRQACNAYLDHRTPGEFKLANMQHRQESNHPWSFRERSRYYFSIFFKKVALVVGVLVALGFFFFKIKSSSRSQVYR